MQRPGVAISRRVLANARVGCPFKTMSGSTANGVISPNPTTPTDPTRYTPTSSENVPVPPYFALSAVLVYVGLLADVFVGAYLDINYRYDPQLEVMATVFQACSFLFTVMCLYNFLGETNLVKRSLFAKLFNEFAPMFVCGGLYFLFIIIVRVYRLALVFASVPHLQIWSQDGYQALYTINKIFSVLYYSACVWATQKVCVSPELVATRAAYITPNPHGQGPRRYDKMKRRTQSSRFDM